MGKKNATSNLEEIKKKALLVLRRHGVLRAAILGSTTHGEATERSDVDLLVTLPDDKSLLDLVRLELDLQKALGRRVDVLTYPALHRRIRERVLREQVSILNSAGEHWAKT
ncbi:MAG: nucleotidyltransferase family protein [Chloroflexi bacterium]|nr:nucleotidyltransferase family protein [Chloroflexota bacterium]